MAKKRKMTQDEKQRWKNAVLWSAEQVYIGRAETRLAALLEFYELPNWEKSTVGKKSVTLRGAGGRVLAQYAIAELPLAPGH